MTFKHLCLDLDGTTLALKSDITDFCSMVLSKVNESTKVILVSARIPSGMIYIQEKIKAEGQPMICYNGAYILDGERIINDQTIALDSVLKVYEICNSIQFLLEFTHTIIGGFLGIPSAFKKKFTTLKRIQLLNLQM